MGDSFPAIITSYEIAIAEFDKAIAINPRYSRTFLFRGVDKKAKGDEGGAKGGGHGD